jgi:LPXTG-site transpeptidase (sortase) family protein
MFGRILLVGACLLAAACPDATITAYAPGVGAVAATTSGELPAATIPAQAALPPDLSPSRLVIPRIGVNARIESRGLDAYRNMLTPKDFHDVAWFNQGPMPGQPGNALLNGHVDWWTGSAVFTRLGELRPGDKVIVIRGDGTRLTFKVTGRQTVAAGARVASLFARSKAATLTLITCAGAWNPLILGTTSRLLVSAVLA